MGQQVWAGFWHFGCCFLFPKTIQTFWINTPHMDVCVCCFEATFLGSGLQGHWGKPNRHAAAMCKVALHILQFQDLSVLFCLTRGLWFCVGFLLGPPQRGTLELDTSGSPTRGGQQAPIGCRSKVQKCGATIAEVSGAGGWDGFGPGVGSTSWMCIYLYTW